MTTKFTKEDLKQLWKPVANQEKGQNGNVTVIGGSELFQGAPLLVTIAASRLVENVFLATPEMDKEIIEKINLFKELRSVIWVSREDIDAYIDKSDAILIGPGMMRYHSESSKFEVLSSKKFDRDGMETREITKNLLQKFPEKKWVIDGGSLQVMEPEWIPKRAVLTCNEKEFEILFLTSPPTPLLSLGEGRRGEVVKEMANKYNCVVVLKGVVTYVSDGETTYEIAGGNAGLDKGGTGDVQAGLTVGLLAKNEPFLAAAAAAFVIKATADKLFEKVGFNFNADDVAGEVFQTFHELTS